MRHLFAVLWMVMCLLEVIGFKGESAGNCFSMLWFWFVIMASITSITMLSLRYKYVNSVY